MIPIDGFHYSKKELDVSPVCMRIFYDYIYNIESMKGPRNIYVER
ncbi:8635_t:CDS:2 [Entrophospora sp. SA101]|nr:8635_t:CDS:2 [Entrophospora sp. SA101]